MTRDQLQDELYALVVAADGARRWETSFPALAADHAARRDVARLNILAEFDRLTAEVARLTAEIERMRHVFEAALRYCRIDGGYDAAGCHIGDVAHYDLCVAAKAAMQEPAS